MAGPWEKYGGVPVAPQAAPQALPTEILGPPKTPEKVTTYSPLPKTDPRYRPDYPSAQVSSTGEVNYGPQIKQEAQNPQQVITQDMNADHVIRQIGVARDQIKGGFDTGNVFGSKTFQGVPYFGQGSANLSATLSGLQGSVINDTIAQLKALSATGASGYGSLSETEAERLAASVAAIQQTQDAASLNRNLDELERHYRAARAILAGQDPRDPKVAAQFGILADGQQPEQQTIPIGAGEFGGHTPPGPPLNPEQQAAFDAWWKAHPSPTADQLRAFGQSMGFTINNADEIIKAKRAGVGVAPASAAVLDPPNISDVRGGQNTPTQDAFNAGVRGLADTVSLGTTDKLIAGADTLFKGGTMDQNLARQYAISDFDAQNHPIARGVGQIGGGVLLPMGEVNSLGNLALKGAGYGAAYGAGSSRSLSDVPVNALLGGAAGATTAAAIGLGGKAIGALRRGPAEVPPLVDPQTGELNQVLDAMPAAQRVQAMKDMGIDTITPGMAGGRTARVLEQGFNNLPASAGTMEDINSAASGELRRAMQAQAQQFGSSKTLNEGGAQLQQGAQDKIARNRSFIDKAYGAIPISDNAPASKTSTLATLQSLTERFQSNSGLASELKDPKLVRYLDALQSGDISWRDLKDFRTIIGEKIGEMRFGESSSTSDLRALYAGLSEDMRNTAAAHGPKAAAAFERANNMNRQNEELIQGALTRILGKDGNMTPERAATAVQAMTKGGKASGDLRTLAQIKGATVKSGAWDEIASTLIHLGGQPANSEGRAFQPATFVNWYSDMSEPARALLFKPELRKSLEQFVAANQQFARLKGLNNTSQTAPVMFGGGALLTVAGAIVNPILGLKMAGMLGANYAMGKLWTSPAFVRLATGYTRAAASGNENAVRSQIGRLQKLATTNPELRAGIEHVLRSIANDNAPMAGQIAASPNQGPEQQGQPQQ